MTTQQLYEELNYVNHSREKRLFYANMVISDTSLMDQLIDILMLVDDKVSPRAAWVLEFVCKENLDVIIPFLDKFTTQMHKVHLDSAVRPIAKICEYLATAFYSKQENKIKSALTKTHQERIIEVSFDYMITDQKIAPKAYAMNTLFLFGKDYDWIHPELILILQKDFKMQSSGFKARAKHILKKLNTNL
ncbi:adenylosuccinate lyase [Mesoflavibacter profundi]|uniref:Adenylosuccinate lyase n=1 Tax=Mesoflavibacter profundi TaxID=2708110 RepID=A0ABT4RZN0_9FLAO|nr:adenylosuccinate lyase [Mesoflavibacter profundi]MDA0176965.1 adenylosuccinate lyase [Mesoflavibacter profundi]